MSYFSARFICTVFVLHLISEGCGLAEDRRSILPIPSADAQSAKTRVVRDVYHDDFENARTPEKKQALATKLLEDGLNTTDDSTARYVLVKTACDMAAAGGDVEGALHTIDQLKAEYDIDSIAVKTQAMSSLAGAIHDRDEHRIMLSQVNKLVKEAISSDRYDLAKQLSALALVSARKARDLAAVKQALSQANEVDAVEKERATIAPALAKLRTSPADPDANSAVGQFLCFVKGDWEEGLPKLAIGSNQSLKKLAERDIALPAVPGEQVILADAWWALTEKEEGTHKRNLMAHAQQLYLQALPQLSGLEEARVHKRVGEMDELQLPTSNLPNGAVVAFDFERKSWNRRGDKQFLRNLANGGSEGEMINGKLVPGVHGTAIEFQGDGYVKFSDHKLPSGDSPRSILFWMKIDKIRGDAVPFSFGSMQQEDGTYVILLDRPRRVTGTVNVGNPGGHNEPGGQVVVTDGKWHHVAVLYDGKSTVQLLVDGRVDLTFSRNYRTSLPGDAFIGVTVDKGDAIYGAIDDFLVLDRALTIEDVKKIKVSGLSR